MLFGSVWLGFRQRQANHESLPTHTNHDSILHSHTLRVPSVSYFVNFDEAGTDGALNEWHCLDSVEDLI